MKIITTIFLITLFGVISCKKNKPLPETTTNSVYKNGILCMNEGLFQQNNATLSFYDLDSNKINTTIFQSINGRGLGDTANEMIEYTYNGISYIAIAVDISSQIEIIEAETFKSVKQIPMFNGTASKEPRSLKFYNDKLYSINYDGTVSVIDLSTYAITTQINCGLNPEYAEIVNGKMYVVNSGGLNYPTYDSTVTVIDLSTNNIETTIETAINCSQIKKDTQGDLYIVSRGNYSNIMPKLQRINSNTNTVEQTFNLGLTEIAYYNNTLFYFDENDNGIHKFNTTNENIENGIFIDCSSFQNIYGIQIDSVNQLIYLTDANGYTNSSIIKCYDLNGNYKYEFNAGLNTGKLIFK
jgi:YVTN family beta-propeller protein